MDYYALHAALVGASFIAVSAYYMHRKTLDQLLELAKTIEKERHHVDESTLHYNNGITKKTKKRKYMHDVTGDEDVIPHGLPRLRTLPQGVNLLGPTSPKSPDVNATVLDSVEGSEDDDHPENANLDTTYLHTNGNSGCTNLNLLEHANSNGEQLPVVASSMINSHSVSGDLHGVQPHPVAADILRKEPEHESFVRLRITPSETPSADEAEVYRALQVCLELQKTYVFRESVAPWEKEVISNPSTPEGNSNPFDYTPERKSNHYFQMEDGVVHVYADKD